MTNYKLGEHLTIKNGKLAIERSKAKLIKLAKQEIKKWQEFLDNLTKKYETTKRN